MKNLEKWRWPETVSFRVTTGEAQQIERKASEQNLTRSEFLRANIHKILTDESSEKENR